MWDRVTLSTSSCRGLWAVCNLLFVCFVFSCPFECACLLCCDMQLSLSFLQQGLKNSGFLCGILQLSGYRWQTQEQKSTSSNTLLFSDAPEKIRVSILFKVSLARPLRPHQTNVPHQISTQQVKIQLRSHPHNLTCHSLTSSPKYLQAWDKN